MASVMIDVSDPACSLAPHDHGPRTCDGCGAPLVGRARRWCGEECMRRFWANHAWTMARIEAIRRSSGLARHAYEDGLPYPWEWWSCDQCGVNAGSPEVNHVEPRNGGGYGNGCWNHQTNLQVLCHACHVAETTRQTRERLGIPEGGWPKAGRRPGEAIPEPLWETA